MNESLLLSLLIEFSILSLLAFGGMSAVLPELQRTVVHSRGWVDERTFTELYSMGYAMPGPNVLVGTMIGFHVAGPTGAFVATIALIIPACIVAYLVATMWHVFRDSFVRKAIQRGVLPITVGLTMAGGYLVARGANETWLAYGLTLGTIALVMTTRVHPLWMVAIGAGVGWLGWL